MKTDPKQLLKGRGLNAWDAYLCSIRGRNIATAFLDELADVFRQFFLAQTDRAIQTVESLVFPRKAAHLASPKRYVSEMPKTGAKRVMRIETFNEETGFWEEDGEFELPVPPDDAIAAAAYGALRATAASLRNSATHDANQCVRQKMWKQSKLRRSVTILSSTKLKSTQSSRTIGDRRLNLRTPHK